MIVPHGATPNISFAKGGHSLDIKPQLQVYRRRPSYQGQYGKHHFVPNLKCQYWHVNCACTMSTVLRFSSLVQQTISLPGNCIYAARVFHVDAIIIDSRGQRSKRLENCDDLSKSEITTNHATPKRDSKKICFLWSHWCSIHWIWYKQGFSL